MKHLSASLIFTLLLLAVNLKGALGYIFRFGEPATSPTYQLIPSKYYLSWKITISLLMAIIVLCKTKRISIRYTIFYSIVLLFSLICIFQTTSFHILGIARCMIMYGLLFVLIVSNKSWIKISHINKTIEFMAGFGLIFIIYQIYQYKCFGILPAHSHANMFIRYGSFYDDSLVLGVLLPMFAGYFFSKYQKTLPSLLTATTVCLIVILTGSMTAMAIVFFHVAWTFRRRYKPLLIFLSVNCIMTIYFFDKIKYVWNFKAGSIAGHLKGLEYFKELGTINILGLSPLNMFAECGYLFLLYNFGVFALIIILAFHLRVLFVCHAINSKNTESRELLNFTGATQGLTISVLIANFNYPAIIYPPVYLMVVVFSAIAIRQASNTNFEKTFNLKYITHSNKGLSPV